MTTAITFSDKDLPKIVKEHIIPLLNQYKIFTFTGPLGVGKTTIIKEIFRQSGITDVVTSPTFSYVNTYYDRNMRMFNHFDLYRIDGIDQFISSGFDELLLQKNSISFIEWPELIDAFIKNQALKNHVCSIKIEYDRSNPALRLLNITR